MLLDLYTAEAARVLDSVGVSPRRRPKPDEDEALLLVLTLI